MKKVLITGVSGQDGIFLTKKLLNEGNFKVYGVSRSPDSHIKEKLSSLNQDNYFNLDLFNINLCDKESVKKAITDIKPNIIFNLSGPSSVYNSFFDDGMSKNIMIEIFNNLMDACFSLENFPYFFQASSSEMYGLNNKNILCESDDFIPNSPYAEGKYNIHKKIIELNAIKGLNLKSGIMFNHESEFRTDDYLFMKIINFASRAKEKEVLQLGSLKYIRDWCFAGDVVDAIYDITLYGKDSVYCIGSGKGNSIQNLVSIIFNQFDLKYSDFVKENIDILRKNDPEVRISNPAKIYNEFGWRPTISFEELVIRCISRKIN